MSDYFDHVEHELRAAVRRHDHLPWHVRLRLRHSRPLVVGLAALVVAGPALAAVTLLRSGSSVGPNVPPTPTAFDGVAITSSIRLLPLRAPDPAGGPSWGLRIDRTTRGVVCLQLGRIAFGTVGALGRDGAFGNDGRFHPFSPDYHPGPPCSVPDAHGNAFVNVAWFGIPASALVPGYLQQGCTPNPAIRRTIEQAQRAKRRLSPVCATADLRGVYYGLLGPDAVSVTHRTASGKLVTTPTGPDGAYLIVLPPSSIEGPEGEFAFDSRVFAGAIQAVHYRDGHTCYPGQCSPVGFVSRAGPLPTPAQVASPVTTRVVMKPNSWCVRLIPLGVPGPCRGRTPPGFQRLGGGPPSALVVFSWISRVAVTNSRSYYRFTFIPPRVSRNPGEQTSKCGTSGQAFGQTTSDYKAGQRVARWFLVPLTCHGAAHGNVSLVITTGPSAPFPEPPPQGQSVARDVGHFTAIVP